jgi:endoglucanase
MEFGAAELALAGRALGDSRAPTWLSQSAHWARTYLNGTDHDTLNLYDVSALAHPDLAAAITATSTSGLEVTVSVLAAGLKGQLDAAVTQAGQDRFRAGANYTEYDATSHELGLIAEAERYDDMVGAATYETFAEQQAGWVLGSNPWGVSMIIGVGTTFAKCPQHQVANLAGSRTGTGSVLVGAAVNGPNATSEFTDIGSIDSALPCPTDGTDVYNSFTGNGARFMDNVAAYQSVEPAIDFTSTGLLAFSLLGRGAASTPPPVVKQDTIGVFRPAGRTVYLRNSLSGGNADVPSFTVGDSGDVPVVGDWNHDGIDTVGTWRPSDQMVRLRNSNTPARPR